MTDHGDHPNLADPDRSSARVAQWAGTLGVLIPAAAIPIYPIWALPSTQTSGTDIALWAAAHHGPLVITQVLYTVGVGLWFVFGAAVWTHLRSRLPAGSPLPTGFLVGIVGLTTLILSGFTAFDLLLYRPRSAEISTLLYDLTLGLLVMSGVPTVVAAGSFAIAVYRYRALRRSTAHVASLAAAGHVALLAAFIAATGPLSLQGAVTVWAIPLLLFAWIGHTSRAITTKMANDPATLQ